MPSYARVTGEGEAARGPPARAGGSTPARPGRGGRAASRGPSRSLARADLPCLGRAAYVTSLVGRRPVLPAAHDAAEEHRRGAAARRRLVDRCAGQREIVVVAPLSDDSQRRLLLERAGVEAARAEAVLLYLVVDADAHGRRRTRARCHERAAARARARARARKLRGVAEDVAARADETLSIVARRVRRRHAHQALYRRGARGAALGRPRRRRARATASPPAGARALRPRRGPERAASHGHGRGTVDLAGPRGRARTADGDCRIPPRGHLQLPPVSASPRPAASSARSGTDVVEPVVAPRRGGAPEHVGYDTLGAGRTSSPPTRPSSCARPSRRRSAAAATRRPGGRAVHAGAGARRRSPAPRPGAAGLSGSSGRAGVRRPPLLPARVSSPSGSCPAATGARTVRDGGVVPHAPGSAPLRAFLRRSRRAAAAGDPSVCLAAG